MRGYLLMIRFQLRLSLSRLSVKDDGKISLKRLGFFALITMAVLSLTAMAAVMEYFFMDALKTINRPALMLVAAALIVMVLALMYGLFYIISTLYYSRDTSFLSSLPISERAIFTGRLAAVLAGECGLSLMILGPAVVIYGLHIKADVWYYLQGALTAVFAPFIPVAIATFVASLLTKFSSLWKRKDLWMVLSVLIVMPLALYIQIKSNQLSFSEDADLSFMLQLVLNQQKLLETVSGYFPPAYWSVSGLAVGGFSMKWLLFIAISVGCIALAVFALGRRYTRLAVLSEEASSETHKRKSLKKERYGIRGPLSALFIREWKEILKTPSYALNCLSSAVIFPLMAVITLLTLPEDVKINEFGTMMNDIFTGVANEVPFGLMAVIAAAVFGFIAIINPAIATAVSREGKCHPIYRMIPVAPKTILLSKFLMGLSLSFIDSVVTLIMVIIFFPGFTLIALAGFLMAMVLAFTGCAVSLLIDVLKPRFDWRTETEVIKRSANILLSMLAGVLLMTGSGFMVNGFYKWFHSFDYAALATAVVLLVLVPISGKLMLSVGEKYYIRLE